MKKQINNLIENVDLYLKSWGIKSQMHTIEQISCFTKINDLNIKVGHVYFCRSNIKGRREIFIVSDDPSLYWARMHPVYQGHLKPWLNGEKPHEYLTVLKEHLDKTIDSSDNKNSTDKE